MTQDIDPQDALGRRVVVTRPDGTVVRGTLHGFGTDKKSGGTTWAQVKLPDGTIEPIVNGRVELDEEP